MGNALKMIMLANGDNRRNDDDRRSNEPMQDRRGEYRGEEMRRSEYRGENRTRSEYRGDDMRRSEDAIQRTDYSRQYPRSEDMRRYREPERTYSARSDDAPEIRRRRDKRGRYMGDDGEEMRMGLYDGGGIGYQTESRRNETYERRDAMHDQPQGKRIHATGSVWMDEEDDAVDTGMLMEWVQDMKDPKGKHIEPWSADEIKPLARRFGYPTTGEEFSDFYTAIHMMKSDYCAVAEEFDVDTPAYYAALADAWLKDPDAKLKGRKKLEAYYRCIVMGR